MTVQLSVDRFEGPWAVLIDSEGFAYNFPALLLPKGTKAGDVLTVTVERDMEATKAVKDETRSIQDELADRDPGGHEPHG